MVSLRIAGENPEHPRFLDWETVGIIHDNFRFRFLYGCSLMKAGDDTQEAVCR